MAYTASFLDYATYAVLPPPPLLPLGPPSSAGPATPLPAPIPDPLATAPFPRHPDVATAGMDARRGYLSAVWHADPVAEAYARSVEEFTRGCGAAVRVREMARVNEVCGGGFGVACGVWQVLTRTEDEGGRARARQCRRWKEVEASGGI